MALSEQLSFEHAYASAPVASGALGTRTHGVHIFVLFAHVGFARSLGKDIDIVGMLHAYIHTCSESAPASGVTYSYNHI